VKWLGPFLLVAVFLRHDTSHWLPYYSAPEWFYILGALWEVILCTCLFLFVHPFRGTSLVIAALWIGILESGQVAICGAVMGHRRAPAGVNDCDYLTGWHVGAIMTGVYLFIVCPAIGKAWRDYFGTRYEPALGIALTIVVAIGGNEIAHLVSPWAAILVMATACIAGLVAYERGT
jgi:hypothetical protein